MWVLELLPFLLILGIPIAFIVWIIKKAYFSEESEVDESLRAKSEAYAKWMKTKSDEDYQKYLELKEARELDKKKRGITNLYD